jgi:hypothetical protein
MIKTSNGKCRIHVQNREVFKANNIFAERSQSLNGEATYTVYSYGYHFPLFVYHEPTGTWFENSNRYSVSTSKHRSQAHPLCPAHKTSTLQLERLLTFGLVDSLLMARGYSQTEEAA